MTNPNDAVGTNAAYDGRTSVNAFNDDLTIYSRGILSGWGCSPKSGMTVQIGGNGTDRDAAVAEDNAGNKTSINNISGSPIDVTIPAAPATNNRIDLIVAYADNPPTGVSTVADNPAACGIIVVSGTAAANPTVPTDATIRSAITTDGATGATAYYVILAQILVGQGVTTIGSGVITQGDIVKSSATAGDDTVTTDSVADGAIVATKLDFTTLYKSAAVLSGNVSVSANTVTQIQTMTLPAGKWRIHYMIRGFYSASGTTLVDSFIYEGNSYVYEVAVNVPSNGTDARFQVIGSTEVSPTTNTTYSTRITIPTSATVSATSFLYAIRVE